MEDKYKERELRDLPEAPHWSRALGVGIVVMGLAIGTGELILWPHLIVKHGLGILWTAFMGIIFQYFINQEVARHEIATGESFFTSSSRIFKWFAPFWLISAIVLYIWPGWASTMGTILRELFGFGDYKYWAIASMILALILTFSGRIAYVVLERSLKIIVPSFFFMLLVTSFLNLTLIDISSAIKGVFNFGFLPSDIDMRTLLGAIVFAGAGGLLNLCVSLWYRDKMFGMGKYAGRIVNPISGKEESVSFGGYEFLINDENISRWKKWMRFVRVDQGIIFLTIGFLTLLMLGLNAYVVLTPKGLVPEGLNVAIYQAHIFGDKWGELGFNSFLVMAFLMLFSVMWTIFDAFTRIVSDILYVNSRTGPFKKYLYRLKDVSESKLYYFLIVGIVFLSALLLPFKQPLALLTMSAVLGGMTMAIYTPMLFYMNNFKLPKPLRPGIVTNFFICLASLFYISFSAFIIYKSFWSI